MRRITREVKIGNITLGGNHPIAVQTMWDRPITYVDKELIERINALKPMGCDLIRFGVPTLNDADRLGQIAEQCQLAVVADIHYDYKIALRCLDYPIAKLRLNPGNIGSRERVAAVAQKAKDKGVPIRIGINGGSLPAALKSKNRVDALVEGALDEANYLERLGFNQIILSMKDSNPYHVLEACRKIAPLCDYPLHLGITEAGPLIPSLTKSAFFLGTLLSEGIGDTLRISISDTIEKEVMAARQLLSVLRLNNKVMPTLVSCPLCARNTFDTHAFAQKIEPLLYQLEKPLKVAVMGCIVNGPGEAADADLAISGAGNKVFVYKKGERVFGGTAQQAEQFFLEQLLGD